jgi:prepilin peptidase CpaA
MVFALALLLTLAAIRDIQTHRIPSGIPAAGLAAGLAGHVWHGGGPGLVWSLAGIAAALPLLLPYAAGALGAGDVKLLMAVGALTGPFFLLWTLLGTIFAGALLAVAWAARRGVLRETVQNVQFGLLLLGTRTGLPALASVSKAGRMPFAPAIALGAIFAFVHLHGRLL